MQIKRPAKVVIVIYTLTMCRRRREHKEQEHGRHSDGRWSSDPGRHIGSDPILWERRIRIIYYMYIIVKLSTGCLGFYRAHARGTLIMMYRAGRRAMLRQQWPIKRKDEARSGLDPKFPLQISSQIPLCKKKISRHIKILAHAWSTKCRWNQKLITQFSCTLWDESFEP
jgi:hypothetical protein